MLENKIEMNLSRLPNELLLSIFYNLTYAQTATAIKPLSKKYKDLIDHDTLFQIRMLGEMPASRVMQFVNDFHLTSAFQKLLRELKKTALEVIYFALVTNNILQIHSQKLQKAITIAEDKLSADLVSSLELTSLAIQCAETTDEKEKLFFFKNIAEAIQNRSERKHYINLSGAKLAGIDLTQVDLSRINFSHATLSRAHLEGSDFRTANLFCADLTEADLRNCNLKEVNLSRAKLEKARLAGVDLTQAKLKYANLESASFKFTKPSMLHKNAELYEADLSNTNLKAAKFTAANLTNANLTNSELKKAQFAPDKDNAGATLTGVTFKGARLSGANLKRVNLKNVDLSQVDKTSATKISIKNFFNRMGLLKNEKIKYFFKKYDIESSANKDSDLEEALRRAATLGQKEDIISLLNIFHVNPCAENFRGHSALDLAEVKGFDDCVELLSKYQHVSPSGPR